MRKQASKDEGQMRGRRRGGGVASGELGGEKRNQEVRDSRDGSSRNG